MTDPTTPQQTYTHVDAWFNEADGVVELRIPLVDGSGDHVLAVLPATPPPADE